VGKHRLRGHRGRQVMVAGLGVLLLAVGVAGFYAWTLNSKLDDIPRIPISIQNRPDPDSGKDVTILLLGSDKGSEGFGGSSLSEDAVADEWPAGKYRSDTLMVVHISENRKRVTVVSIPRDTFTMIHDENGEPTHEDKINSAFSRYGPVGAVATVEHLTNLRMDHLAILDWAGFKDLSTAVGGVPVHIPESFYDSKQKVRWEAGDHVLKGDKALQYVRTRYGLLRGDFDRIERQQNFLRSLMKEMIASGDIFKPLEFNDMLGALTRNLTVDEGWDNGEIRSLGLSLRGTKADEVIFLTTPVAGTPTIPTYGSIVELNDEQTTELFTLLRDDRAGRYVKAHPDAVLPDEDEID
jgi:LCP family protein required for cell wall assembly